MRLWPLIGTSKACDWALKSVRWANSSRSLDAHGVEAVLAIASTALVALERHWQSVEASEIIQSLTGFMQQWRTRIIEAARVCWIDEFSPTDPDLRIVSKAALSSLSQSLDSLHHHLQHDDAYVSLVTLVKDLLTQIRDVMQHRALPPALASPSSPIWRHVVQSLPSMPSTPLSLSFISPVFPTIAAAFPPGSPPSSAPLPDHS